MAIDWDGNCFGPVHAVFGETDQPVTYTPVNGNAFIMADAIFEDAYVAIEMSEGMPVPTAARPAIEVRLASYPAGVVPCQGDQVYVPRMNASYVVKQPQPDRDGAARLLLQKV